MSSSIGVVYSLDFADSAVVELVLPVHAGSVGSAGSLLQLALVLPAVGSNVENVSLVMSSLLCGELVILGSLLEVVAAVLDVVFSALEADHYCFVAVGLSVGAVPLVMPPLHYGRFEILVSLLEAVAVVLDVVFFVVEVHRLCFVAVGSIDEAVPLVMLFLRRGELQCVVILVSLLEAVVAVLDEVFPAVEVDYF